MLLVHKKCPQFLGIVGEAGLHGSRLFSCVLLHGYMIDFFKKQIVFLDLSKACNVAFCPFVHRCYSENVIKCV